MTLPTLMISYEAPPRQSAESILTGKTCKALAAVAPDAPVIDLVCAAPGDEVPADEQLTELLPDSMRVHRIDPVPRGRKTILRRIIGGKGGWQREAVARSMALFPAEHKKPALLYSRSHPPASHLAALELIQGPLQGVPWVAHFSDPWSQHAYYKSRVTRAALKHYERQIIAAATRLVFVSQALQDTMLAEAPSEIIARARVIPHCFDPELYAQAGAAPPVQEPPGVRTIAHIGDLYALRSPQTLFAALALLLKNRPELAQTLAVWQIGRIDPVFEQIEERATIDPMLRVVPPVPYHQSLAAMASADVLLTIEAPVRHSIFFPSKLVDYLGARKPLLALTPKDSLTARLMHEWQQVWCDINDVSAIALQLQRVADGQLWAPPPESVLEPYRARSVGAKLMGVFNEVLGTGS